MLRRWREWGEWGGEWWGRMVGANGGANGANGRMGTANGTGEWTGEWGEWGRRDMAPCHKLSAKSEIAALVWAENASIADQLYTRDQSR
ncbi:MAG TPA: hypothetical protein VH325_17325 [Bryobacteraceae bacterium]|nr:hypothetical protein [Bryobacteraceae bacterium]